MDVRFEHGSVVLKLAERQVLSQQKEATLVAAPGTEFRFVLNSGEVRFSALPPLRVLVHEFDWATEDVEIVSARYSRHTRRAEVEVRRVPTWELNLASGAVRRRAEELITNYLSNLDLDGLTQGKGLDSLSGGEGGPGSSPAPDTLEITEGRITISLPKGLKFRRGSLSAEIPAGARVTFDARTAGDVDLFRILSVDITAKPPLQVSDSQNTIAVRAVHARPSERGVVVRSEARDIRFIEHGNAASALVGSFALFGLIGGVSKGLPPQLMELEMKQTMAEGDKGARTLAAGKLDEAFTKAVGLMLEEARPELKKQAPFIDWDGLLQKKTRQPALPRPVHHAP